MAKPTADQLTRINKLALVPLSDDETYVFPAKLIGDQMIPGRFYRLTANFLRKMAVQAKAGVSLLLDHSWTNFGVMTIPIGRTFDSRLQMDGDEMALYADHYMKLGQEVGEIKTDQIADGIDAGTIFDTSIGFIGTKNICSICHNEYYSQSCGHIRGRTYDGNLCTVDIDDGDLMENSLVFDGAYPGAGIVGLNQSNDGQQPTRFEVLSEDTKSLPGDGRVFYSFSSKSGLIGFIPKTQEQQQQQKKEEAETLAEGDETVDNKEQAVQSQQLQQARTALEQTNGLLSQIRAALNVEADGGILTKIASLSSQAQVGETYKTKIIEEACGAGVRALGEAFNVDAMKLSLSGLPVTEIEKVRDSYNAQAQKVLGGGGRHTQGEDVDLPTGALAGAAPTNQQANGGQPTPEQLQAKAREEARTALKNTGHESILKKEAN